MAIGDWLGGNHRVDVAFGQENIFAGDLLLAEVKRLLIQTLVLICFVCLGVFLEKSFWDLLRAASEEIADHIINN